MDLNIIKKLIKLVESSQIEELEVQDEGLQIRITKSKSGVVTSAPQPVVQASSPAQTQTSAPPEIQSESSPSQGTEIPSPMVGTFYRASAPDAEPFIKEGEPFKAGDVLCIVEAMKLMNEIEAECSGKILKILVENGQAVEFNQPLFLIEKT